MAGSIEGDRGGILGLLGLLDEHQEAIDYDCLTLGLDLNELGTEPFDWRRFRAVVTNLPRTSALARSMHGEAVAWDTTDHLLAAAVDALNAGNWQRGGGKGRRPKPIPRPGESKRGSGRTLGTASLTPAELDLLLARPRRPVSK